MALNGKTSAEKTGIAELDQNYEFENYKYESK